MNQHDTHCKRRHGYKHSSSHRAERRLAAERLKNQCELVNKIASIDIWATERLYEKWRRQATVDETTDRFPSRGTDTLHNGNTSHPFCKRHSGGGGGGKFFKARLAQPSNAKLLTVKMTDFNNRGRDTAQLQSQHACHKRRTQSRPDEWRRSHAQEHYLRQKQHHRQLSLSSETTSQSRCQCQQKHHQQQQQDSEPESERTSDMDWPDSWPSICGSSQAKSEQRASSSSDRLAVAAATQMGVDSDAPGYRDCRSDKRHRHLVNDALLYRQLGGNDNRRRQRSEVSRPSGGHRHCNAKHSIVDQNTVEAIVTLNLPEPADMRKDAPLLAISDKNRHRGDRKDEFETTRDHNRIESPLECEDKESEEKRPTVCRLSSNSSKQRSSRVRKQSSPLDQVQSRQPRQRSIDQRTYTIIRNITCSPMPKHPIIQIRYDEDCETMEAASCSYNTARVCRTDRLAFEQAEQLPKPVVWLMAEPSKPEVLYSSENDSSTQWMNTIVDSRTLSPATSAATTATRRVRKDAIRRTTTAPKSRKRVMRDFEAAPIACNNSVKALLMLSTATNEAPSSGSVCAALISNSKPSRNFNVAKSYFPEVRMQSNAADESAEYMMLSDDLDGIIQTQVEIGESKGIEPKSGSVSRFVQDEVLKAAKLVATMGFAGLVGIRPSESEVDPKSTATIGTEEPDDVAYDNTDSLGSLDDLEEMDSEEDFVNDDDMDEGLEGEVESDVNVAPPKGNRRKAEKRSKGRGRTATRHGGDAARDGSSSRRLEAGAQKTLLPMTECPTTKHRIECYRTQSGRVKCYVTARHPVKCRVQGGRIVCKATVKSEASDLPYPCNAAWQ